MDPSKIIKVVNCHEGEKHPYMGGMFHVWFEIMPEQVVAMFKAQYEMVEFEAEMLKKGISKEDILKHRDLVTAWRYDEECEAQASEDI